MNRSLPDIPKEWIQQARLADESAIEKIYSKTYPKAYTIAYYSLGATNKFKDEAQIHTFNCFITQSLHSGIDFQRLFLLFKTFLT